MAEVEEIKQERIIKEYKKFLEESYTYRQLTNFLSVQNIERLENIVSNAVVWGINKGKEFANDRI